MERGNSTTPSRSSDGNAVTLDGARGHRHPGEAPLRLDDERLERLGEEPRTALGGTRVDLEVDLLGVDARLEQLGGHPERPRPGIAEAEPAGIGEDADVESPRRLPAQGPSVGQGDLEDQLGGRCGAGVEIAGPVREEAGAHVVIDTCRGHAAIPDRLSQHAEAAEIGDVEHDDQVGAPKLLDGFGGPVYAGEVIEEEGEAWRRGRRIGDRDVHALAPKQVGQPRLAAEPITIGIDVGGETHPPPGHEFRREGPGGGNTIWSKRKRHGAKVIV